MLMTGACAMPKPLSLAVIAAADQVTSHNPHAAHSKTDADDCSLKPCPTGQPTPSLNLKLDHLEIPLLCLGLAWLSSWLIAERRQPIRVKPPARAVGSPVPLIYRFCILLN